MIGLYLSRLISFLFPDRCIGCGRAGSEICGQCAARFPGLFPQLCPVCEKPAVHGLTHYRCNSRSSPDGLISAWRYQGFVRKILKLSKFRPYRFALGKTLAGRSLEQKEFLADLEIIGRLAGDKAALVPVPLSFWKGKLRGYNQAEVMGRIISGRLRLPVDTSLIKRIRHTQSQYGLSERERQNNLSGAFEADPAAVGKYSAVILFDDILTTGTTLRNCCLVLKKAGIKKVYLVTLAR